MISSRDSRADDLAGPHRTTKGTGMNSTRTLRLAAPCALILLAAAPGLAQDGVIAEQAPGAALASTLMDARVVSAAGEAIGDVEDLIVGPDGRIAGVVVGVGGFLDVGEKDVAFEMARLERATGEGGGTVFVLGASAA